MTFHGFVLDAYAGLPVWAQFLAKGLAFAVAAYFVGALARRLLVAAFARSRFMEATLASFLQGLLTVAVWIAVVLAFLAGYGVDPVALVGTLAIGGFILGFALKDVLGNFAAGMMLLLHRPFRVGEAVEIRGHAGVVLELGAALTRLRTWDGRIVTIPNGAILGDSILNFSRNPERRVDVDVGVRYADDLDVALRALLEAAGRDPRVLAEPPAQVVVTGLGESSVNLQLRAWVPGPEWGTARSDLIRDAKRAVEAAGCAIPFPQREIQMRGDPKEAQG